ncbi:MAG: type-F conjugative transfer system secretin TraK [Gammaproteobacteria bacterium]|nr:type-F conjugative transfer system secretin TraK [Gammaproteobacteria bacterium]
MHPLKLIVALFTLSWSLGAQATQRVFIQEGFTTRATVGAQHLNHIAIEDDRITSVKALQGQFELDKDSEAGQIFIKPLEGAQNPMALFLSTEAGKTYTLELSLHAQSAQSIVLVPPLPPEPTETDYLSLLQQIISDLHKGHTPRDFVSTSVNIPIRFSKELKGRITQVYQGPFFKAEILELQNVGSTPLSLTELDLYQEDVKAISIIDKTLAPKAFTKVYWVRP